MAGASVIEPCDRDKDLWSVWAADLDFSVAEPSDAIFWTGLRQKGPAFLAVHRLPGKKTFGPTGAENSGWNTPINLEKQANGYPKTDS